MFSSMGNCLKQNPKEVATNDNNRSNMQQYDHRNSRMNGGSNNDDRYSRSGGGGDHLYSNSRSSRSGAHNDLDYNEQRTSNRLQNDETTAASSKKSSGVRELVICVVGLDDAGKSTTAKVLKGDKDIKDVAPTIGYEPHEIKYDSKTNVKIYDLGGGARVRDIWKHYLAESYGFIYVIDSSKRNRMNECRSVFSSFVESEKVAGKPILILANKQDQPNALDESDIIQYLSVEELVNKFQIPCRIETCTAVQGIGNKVDPSIKIGFDWLVKLITAQYDELKTRIDYDSDLQRNREDRLKKEKYERIRQKRDAEDPDYYSGTDKYSNSSSNPWKPIGDLTSSKDSKSKLAPLSSYDRQLLDDMRVPSPKSRLSTIDEEKSRSKNRFLKSNKLSPYDDGSDYENSRSKSTAWAITDSKRNASSSLRSRFEP